MTGAAQESGNSGSTHRFSLYSVHVRLLTATGCSIHRRRGHVEGLTAEQGCQLLVCQGSVLYAQTWYQLGQV
jgi:hypothetical protein